MAKKSKLLKNLLTTASALAVITTTVNAYAALDSDDMYNLRITLSSPGIAQKLLSEGLIVGGQLTPEGAEVASDAIKRIPAEIPILADLARDVSSSIVANRIGGRPQVLDHKAELASSGNSGLSAGDYTTAYGVWGNPSMLKVKQKANKGAAGYTASVGGTSLGFDTKANEDMVIGLALSYLNTHVKHKDFRTGDKRKVDSVMLSIYGLQQLTDNWYTHGIVTVGTNKVKTTGKRRTGITSTEFASGNYRSMSFLGELMLGYNSYMKQASFTPMVGVRVTKVNNAGYTETGTANQNLIVSIKELNRVELVAGARLYGSDYTLNGLTVLPEIHGFVNHDVIAKKAKSDVRLTSVDGYFKTKDGKPTKTLFNAGLSLNTSYNKMEYGLGYDAHMAKKYVAHQANLRVRVNF
jgi:outer membrane autotransporter protein